MDGWGRPFDVVAACAALNADVLVLQESWCPEGGTSTAALVAERLGYRGHEVALAHGRLFRPDPDATGSWGPRPGRGRRTLRLDERRAGPRPPAAPGRPFDEGTWSLALLVRLPAGDIQEIPLGQLARDRARRAALAVEVTTGSGPVTVVGTHLSHLSQGSPVQFRRLAAALPPGEVPAAVAGDLNLWGPAVVSLLPGWRRAVTGRTWPAWRPHSQPDHVLVNAAAWSSGGSVGPPAGSDHRPVRALVGARPAAWPPARTGSSATPR